MQPVEKPPEPKPDPPKEEEEEEEGDPEGVEGGSKEGVAGGRLDGVEGGMLGPSGAVGPPAAPAPPPPKPRVVAQFIFDRERVKYPDPHLPEGFVASHPHQMVRGMYRICVDVDGQINKMETITSLSGADQAIIAWQQDGKPLENGEGFARLIVPGDKAAGRAVSAVTTIEVK